jgi:cell division protein ZapA
MSSQAKTINRVKVKINGEDYYIKGKESTDYIEKVAYFVDKNMQELSKRNPELNSRKIAVLTALNITDQLFKAKFELEELISILDTETKG